MLHSPPPSENSSTPQGMEAMAVDSPPKAAKGSRFSKGRLPILHNGVFWAATPALALFALSVFSSNSPLPSPIGRMATVGTSVISADNWVVPASQTILVSRQAAGRYTTLRGRLEVAGSEPIPSPGSGEVARMLVSPGQNVRAGQQIAFLTTGIAPGEERVTAPSPIEHWQTQAESAQIAAAQQQEKLEKKISAANEELHRAKQRVAAAQERVADARQLIARLQKGEEISSDEAPAPTPTPQSTSQREDSAAKAAALRESQKLQAEAEAAEAKARDAVKAVREAEAQAASQQQKLETALAAAKTAAKAADKSAVSTAEGDKADNKVDGKAEGDSKSSVQPRSSGESVAAAKAVSAARANAAEATAHVADLRRNATKLESRADAARSKANAAARRATQNLQLFDGESSASTKVAASSPGKKSSSEKMSIAQAARIARAAMQESESAIKDAERIRRQVEKYGRPVESTRQRFDQATRQLQAAQQRMWDNAPTMRTTQKPVFADRGGIITWVAAPSRVVHSGDAVASIGRPDRLEVVVQDKSNSWKALKPNARVLALVQRKGAVADENAGTGTPDATAPDAVTSDAATPDVKPHVSAASTSVLSSSASPGNSAVSIPTVARVIAIAPPTRPNGVARIRIAVHNPPEQIGNNRNGLSPRAFAPGMPVFFSLAQPTRKTAIRIPTAAVRREPNGKTFVAVLSPVENQEQDRLADQCRVQWREVFLAPGDGVSNQVKMGLKEGERVALRPDALYNFTLAYGAQATVSVEQI